MYNAARHFVLKNKNGLRCNISPMHKEFKRDRKISYVRLDANHHISKVTVYQLGFDRQAAKLSQ